MTSAVEHSSVLHAGQLHERDGGSVETVGVSLTGRVDLPAFEAAVAAPGTALACLQTANHEVGTPQPVGSRRPPPAGSTSRCWIDAAQTAGRLPVPEGGRC